MISSKHLVATALAVTYGFAFAQKPAVLGDLPAQDRVTLGKDELNQLLPGAKMRRVNNQGSFQAWSNDPSGSFVVSSDNRGTQGNNSTANGSWKISDDGRYCLTIEWKRNPLEDWCRLIVKAGGNYYVTRSDKVETERIHLVEISK